MKFIKSEYADSIYYADLFKINNKVWMIMGHGKSKAASIASNKIAEDSINRDCTAIKIENKTLKAKNDVGAINIDLEQSKIDELNKFYDIDYVAYCLSPEDTEEIFQKNERTITKASLDDMSYCSTIYPYTGHAAKFVFSNEEVINLNNKERRINKFKEIVSQDTNVELLFIPFMETLQEKAELYKKYV